MKPFFLSILFISLLSPLKANLYMEKVSESAPKKYVYTDGSNNHYLVIQTSTGGTVEYDPITEAESSSGTYNGGEPWKVSISKEEFKSLVDLLTKATKDESQLIKERNMGCGTIVLPKNKIFFLRMNAANKTIIENRFKEIKKSSTPEIEKTSTADTLTATGKIIERNFVSKKGVVQGITEFYFIPEQVKDSNWKDEYFIKLSKGKVTRDEMKKYLDKSVTLKGVFNRGLWDADDNTHQSRFGDYIIVLEIVK